ncbi:hypothetical protein [Pseudonocardia sp.]|jgi:hypothetical protein|uniref:hypothetical protein n=1 Tax=Pseudonocardia sp. TaxID=60912 RepID=UPI0031FD7A8C
MLKKTIAVACAAAVLAGWGVPMAQAASRATSAVSDVELSWTGWVGWVRITWSETTPSANTISFERDGVAPVQLGTRTTDGANELWVTTSKLAPTDDPADVGRIIVTDSDGGTARSVDFDRYIRTAPSPTLSFTPENGVKWSIPADTSIDTTAGDPLDAGSSRTTYYLELRLNEPPNYLLNCRRVYLNSTYPGALSGVIDKYWSNKPFSITMLSLNAWESARIGGSAEVGGTGLTLTAPAATAHGKPFVLTGRLNDRGIFQTASPPVCQERELGPVANELVVLQARNSGTSPWYVVGTTRSAPTGQYSFSMMNAGTREYRVVVPNTTRAGILSFGGTTASKVVKATTQVVSAKFIAPVLTYGKRPQAYLWVAPGGSQRAALQFRNPNGTWQGLTYKTLYAGRGIATFAWSRRGATPFRWWVPASTTSTGLRVEPVYSGIFTLTVR